MSRIQKSILFLTAVCQTVFLVSVIFFYDVLIWAGPCIRELTYEEWGWMIENSDTIRHVSDIPHGQTIFTIVKVTLLILLAAAYAYILLNKKSRNAVGKKLIWASVLIEIIVYVDCFLYNKHIAEHYRMFMPLISVFILSVGLTVWTIKWWKSSQSCVT